MAAGKSILQSKSAPAGAPARVRSIAGNAHGVKPSQNTDSGKSPRKWYPQLEGLVHPEVVSAMRVMFDNLYQLRDDHASLKSDSTAQGKAAGAVGSGSGSAGGEKSSVPDSAMATGIHGIRIQPATDPSTLKTGDTIRYNEATSQFEFGS